MTTHTPGPWSIKAENGNYWDRTTIMGPDGLMVADCDLPDYRFDSVNFANALVTAAAPDMLEALEDIIADAEYLALVGDNHARRMKAKAAIAKARGRAK